MASWLHRLLLSSSQPGFHAHGWGLPFPRVSSFFSLGKHSSAIAHVSAQTSPAPPGSLPWFSKQNQLSVPYSLSLQQALASPERLLLSCSCNTCFFTHLPSSLDSVPLNTVAPTLSTGPRQGAVSSFWQERAPCRRLLCLFTNLNSGTPTLYSSLLRSLDCTILCVIC